MNIIDAIKSGKPFRHITWESPTYYLGPLDLADKMNLYQTTWQELISDDWQTKEPTVTLTASQFWTEVHACSSTPLGHKLALDYSGIEALAKALGLVSN